MKLRDWGLYQFQGDPSSPFQGQYFLVRQVADEYALYSAGEIAELVPAPQLVVDSRGRILFRGYPTGHTAEMLVDTGRTAGEEGRW